jgi:phosphoribosylaminoimidazole-succinocarboxamide synthase
MKEGRTMDDTTGTTRGGARPAAVMETHLALPLVARGKVRDIYEAGARLLIVATDRLSAFDCVLPTGIPDRGRVLTGLSVFWFERLRGIVPNHYISVDVDEFPEEARRAWDLRLAGRAMLVERCRRIDFECVVRGYLAGSAWKEYRETGRACGVALPAGLTLGSRLPRPVFTPATKSDAGHDENITIDTMAARIGEPLARRLEAASIALYREAAAVAERAGFILVDTKFEFGLRGDVPAAGDAPSGDGDIVLIDEAVTPDSSRFWDARTYAATGSTESYDKQVVRDYLERIGWNKQPPAPALPPEIIEAARGRYLDVYRRITGRPLVEE